MMYAYHMVTPPRHFEATQSNVCNAPFISVTQLPCQNSNVHHAINILAYTKVDFAQYFDMFWDLVGAFCNFWHPKHGELTVCWPDPGTTGFV